MELRWARSARRHGVNRERVRHVIDHSGLRFRIADAGAGADARYLYVGDDAEGIPLEVVAVQPGKGELLVIHAMSLRSKYELEYREAQSWRV